MKTINGIVLNANGLTSRIIVELVSEANHFESNLTIKVLDEDADLKSIMNVMALVVPKNTEFEIQIEGKDEDKAAEKLEVVLKNLHLKA